MTWAEAAAFSLAVGVGVVLSVLAVGDARTGRVRVRSSQALTAFAVGGLGLVALGTGAWVELIGAVAGAAVITAVQLVPYALAVRAGTEWIGRADLRLGVPVGWTLGWFGLGFALVGFLAALLAGLALSAVTRRRRVPFVPCLAVGFWFSLAWAATVVAIAQP